MCPETHMNVLWVIKLEFMNNTPLKKKKRKNKKGKPNQTKALPI